MMWVEELKSKVQKLVEMLQGMFEKNEMEKWVENLVHMWLWVVEPSRMHGFAGC